MIRKTGSALAAASLLVCLAAIGFWLLFSTLALYDDEGYILISAREYFGHGGLYESVYSQYGPAFYVLADAVQHLARSPLDHTTARLLTLGLWLGAAAGCAILVHRQTASRLLAGFTLTATFFYLYFIIDEPFHPGSLICFLLALTLGVITELVDRGRLAGAAAVAGATAGLLVLTKINVGAFFLAGAGAWAVLNATAGRRRRAAGGAVAAALVLLAGVLMLALRREGWVQVYLALFAVGTVTLVAAVPTAPLFRARHAALAAATGAGTACVILGLVWMRGTSLAGLVEGVVLGPLRHPVSYSYPVDWRPGSLALAGLSLVLALAHGWLRRRFSEDAADRLVVVLRVGQAAALLTGLALLMNFRVVGAVFSYVAPLIWTWVIPLRGATGPRPTAACRGLLAFVLLLQFLHAYPIGGSQESWATFLFLPLVALGLGELRSWRPAAPAGVKAPPRGWPVLAATIGIVLVAKTGWMAGTAYQRFASRSDLALPGAMNLRLPESQRTAYQLLALNAVVHGDQLFSLPGMFSFNLWTDLPTPTRMNTTLWFTLLNDAEQAAIIAAIERAPRPCIIVQESLVRLMQAGQVPIRGILSDYVHRNFALAFRVEGFAFLVRSGRTIAPLDVARLTALAPARPAAPDTQIDLWLLSDGTPIEALEACDLTKPGAAQLTLNAANTQATLVAVDRANRQAGGPETAAWPLRFKGVAHLSLQFNRAGVALSPFTTEFHVKGPGNRTLGEVRINE